MKRKYRVTLSPEERKLVFETVDGDGTSKTVRRRCNILLLADESAGKAISHEEIAVRCGVSDVTVYQTVKDYQIHGISHVLRRRTHKEPPRKPIVTGETEARLIALACGAPPEGFTRWTVRLLTQRVVELEIVPSIGRETVRTALKKHNLSHI